MTIEINEIYVNGVKVFDGVSTTTAWFEVGEWKYPERTRVRNNVRVIGRVQAVYSGDVRVAIKFGGYLDSAVIDGVGQAPETEQIIRDVTAGEWYEFDVNKDLYYFNSSSDMLWERISDANLHNVVWSDGINAYYAPTAKNGWIKFASGNGEWVLLRHVNGNPGSDIRTTVDGSVTDTDSIVESERRYDICMEAGGDFEVQVNAWWYNVIIFEKVMIVREVERTGRLSVTAINGQNDERAVVSLDTKGYYKDWFQRPNIVIEDVRTDKDVYMENEDITITVQLHNLGRVAGTVEVVITANDVEIASATVTVDPNDYKFVRATGRLEPGNYNICAELV